MPDPNGKQSVGMLLNWPADLHARMKAIAARERRTLQAQTLLALEQWTDEREEQLVKLEGESV